MKFSSFHSLLKMSPVFSMALLFAGTIPPANASPLAPMDNGREGNPYEIACPGNPEWLLTNTDKRDEYFIRAGCYRFLAKPLGKGELLPLINKQVTE